MRFHSNFSYLYVSILLPYIAYIFNSFDFGLSILLYSFIILISLFYFENFIYKKKWIFISLLLILFFYSERIFSDLFYFFQQYNIRFRHFLVLISLLVLILLYRVNKKKISQFFFLFFITTTLITEKIVYEIAGGGDYEIKYSLKHNKLFSNISAEESPVILIILDEYASDKSLKITDNSFRDSMNDLGFLYYDDIKTNEPYTYYAMPSLFNFNLNNSDISVFKKERIPKSINTPKNNFLLNNLFKNNSLKDSLDSKNIKVESYGLMNFSSNQINNLSEYLWEPHLEFNFEEIAKSTILNFLYTKESVLERSDKVDKFRNDVFEKLKKISPIKNTFYYFHIYLPHDPFRFNNEFYYNKQITETENYISFREFLQNKLIEILDEGNFIDSRIIIAGDHGYRKNDSIDQLSTSVFLKGYNKKNILNEFNVQDLGYLIYNSFK